MQKSTHYITQASLTQSRPVGMDKIVYFVSLFLLMLCSLFGFARGSRQRHAETKLALIAQTPSKARQCKKKGEQEKEDGEDKKGK